MACKRFLYDFRKTGTRYAEWLMWQRKITY